MATDAASQAGGDMASGASLTHAALVSAVDGARGLLGAARIAVLLPDAGALRGVARRGFSADAVRDLAGLLTTEEPGRALAAGAALAPVLGCVWTPELGAWQVAHAGGAFLAVPLPVPGSAPGVLALGFEGGAQVTSVRIHAAKQFAAPLAVAVVAARRAVELERRPPPASPPQRLPSEGRVEAGCRADSAGRTRFAQAITEVLAVTGMAGNVATAAELAAMILLRVMPGIDFVYAWALDEDDEQLFRVATAGEPPNPADSDRLPLADEVGVARAIKEGRPIIWHGDRRRWPARVRKLAARRDLATVAHVPMHSNSRMLGALTLCSHRSRRYTEDELSFLTTLAGQLGTQLDVVRGHAMAEDERRRLRSLIDTLPEGLMMIAADGRVRMYNQAAVAILGRTPGDEPLGLRARDYALRLPTGNAYTPADQSLIRALRGRTVRALELVLCRPDGGEVPLLVSAAPVRAADGAVEATIILFQDITRLKELDRLKDDFINTVSHELRTPTTTIRGGALTLLRRGDRLDEDTRRLLLQDIAEESERLHHLVEDLLSMSRSQAGMKMSPEPLRLHRLVNKVVIDMGGRLGTSTIQVEVSPALPLVEADPLAIEQVLRNLIENAVRHSPRAERVEITAEAEEEQVVVRVLDRGPGLDPEDLDRIFEPFYRSQAAVRAGTQGAGLGLAVCRRLVEMNGGRIRAEQRPDGGAAFRFTLPRAPEVED